MSLSSNGLTKVDTEKSAGNAHIICTPASSDGTKSIRTCQFVLESVRSHFGQLVFVVRTGSSQ